MLEILDNARIAYRVAGRSNQVVLRPKACPSHDDDVARGSRWLPWEMRAHGPRSTSARVAGGLMGRQYYSPEAYLIAVVENAVHVHRGVAGDIG